MHQGSGRVQALFTVVKLEDFVATDHAVRAIRETVNEALSRVNDLFDLRDTGRASMAPEKSRRAKLIRSSSVRSERQLMEQVRYNLLYRWFDALTIDDDVWHHSTFSKNRERWLEHAVVESFVTEVMTRADSETRRAIAGFAGIQSMTLQPGERTITVDAASALCDQPSPPRRFPPVVDEQGTTVESVPRCPRRGADAFEKAK